VLKKIVSGGQTGADQAALDAALELGLPHGGWIPKGRKTESGPLPVKYQLQEMDSGRYSKRTRQNVIDSDGTVIFYMEKLTGGSKYTVKMAVKHKRPHLRIDLNALPAFQAVSLIHSWVFKNNIGVLNVAGPRARKNPRVYVAVKFVISCVILSTTSENQEHHDFLNNLKGQNPLLLPKTLDEAANRVISRLPHMDRAIIANMEIEELEPVYTAYNPLIKNHFSLDDGDSELIAACRREADLNDIEKNGAATVILHKVWEKLRESDEWRLMR
jgi:hypothetical protein